MQSVVPYTGTLVESRKYTTIHLESSYWYFCIKVVYMLHVGSEIFHDAWGGHMYIDDVTFLWKEKFVNCPLASLVCQFIL